MSGGAHSYFVLFLDPSAWRNRQVSPCEGGLRRLEGFNCKGILFKYILEEKEGIKVELFKVSLDEIWKGVAEGKYDAMLCAKLPDQQSYYDKFGKQIVDLGPNWMDEKSSVHTIVRKGLQESRPTLARYLNNFCLCGSKLDSALALVEGGAVSKKAATKWMKANEECINNMMGLCKNFTIEDWG